MIQLNIYTYISVDERKEHPEYSCYEIGWKIGRNGADFHGRFAALMHSR